MSFRVDSTSSYQGDDAAGHILKGELSGVIISLQAEKTTCRSLTSFRLLRVTLEAVNVVQRQCATQK